MSYSHQQNDPTKNLAKKGLSKAGNALKNVTKKFAMKATKKVIGGILLKTSPIWGGFLAILLIVVVIIAILTPDFSKDEVKEKRKLMMR
ncbi:hypothetical protein [Robertmurraya massiliosenegalensis]|uniref:hypothetical protein n=1 Tax=Robertmurraya massiliosenegalensis TaxID=1287657 RepID=UPI0002FDF6A9|nr:hypothetical protein [Robertmurraya massiliosenegalensis]